MKRVLTVSVIILILLSTIVYASGLLWGPLEKYGANHRVTGDLTPSGLGSYDSRNADYFRHDVRLKNVITNQYNPYTGYFEAGGFELQALIGEPAIVNNGYLLVPWNDTTIRNVVEQTNGNFDTVWAGVPTKGLYEIDGIQYASFYNVVFYSGGGGGIKEATNIGNGETSPKHRSVFDITPKPEIKTLEFSNTNVKKSELNNHKLTFESLAYSANWELANITRFYLNGPSASNTELSISRPADTKQGSYTAVVKKDFPLDFLSSFQAGKYTLTARTSDPFERHAEKTATITITDDSGNPPPGVASSVFSVL